MKHRWRAKRNPSRRGPPHHTMSGHYANAGGGIVEAPLEEQRARFERPARVPRRASPPVHSAPARDSLNQEVGTRPPARKKDHFSCGLPDNHGVSMGSGSPKRPRRMPDSPCRVLGLPLGDLGKSSDRARLRAPLDRGITVEDLAYPHGRSADRAGSAMHVRLTRSSDAPDRSRDRASGRMGIPVIGRETPHRDPRDFAWRVRGMRRAIAGDCLGSECAPA